MTTCTVLASSSKANCVAVENSGEVILIDCGLSARAATNYLLTTGTCAINIASAILLTHEHADHSAGVKGFISKHEATLVTKEATAEAIGCWKYVEPSCVVGPFDIHAFPVPHDAADPIGFVIQAGGRRIGYCTDIGVVTRLMFERLKGCELLFIEANHDVRMAQASDRHDSLKHRIAGAHGHISNDAAGMLIAALVPHGLKKAVLCHLSKDCNEPSVALGTVKAAAPACEIHVADFGLKVTI